MTTAYQVVINTPIGPIGLGFEKHQLAQVDFLSTQVVPLPFTSKQANALKAFNWFEYYFQSPQKLFALPLQVKGTSFQRKVWKALLNIPFGKTVTYGELASLLETSARAIGLACRRNPLPIVIPCHRVVAKNGIGGYCGQTDGSPLARKSWLLQHEATYIKKLGRAPHDTELLA